MDCIQESRQCHFKRQVQQCYRRRHCARAVIPKVKLDSPFRSKEKSDHSGRGFRLAACSEPGCAIVDSELPTKLGFPSGLTRPYFATIVWAQCHCIRYRRRQNWAGQSLRQTLRAWVSFDVDLERPKILKISRDVNQGSKRGATDLNHLGKLMATQ